MDSTDILISIRRIVRSINLESKKIQRQFGVSIPQILCLGFLSRSTGYHASQNELKHYLNLNASTVTGIVKRLEQKGLVARLPRSGDKRVSQIILTSQGDELLKRIPPLLHEQLEEKLVSLDPAELSDIENSLEKLVSLLNIGSVEASPFLSGMTDLESQEE
ncbi:MAG TPA: MarR family transcriptional regulator [Bacteroidales bacterium]|nr:MarR family transcriptional regulator [Bacteroidales bacterium]